MSTTDPSNKPLAQPAERQYDYQVYYSHWHSESPEHVRSMARMLAAQLGPIVAGRERGVTLDIGCGMGFAILGLKQLGFVDVQGVDCDPGQARSAQNLGLKVECVADTADYLRRTPGKFDTILLLDVLEHVPVAEQIVILKAVHGALRENGRLVIQVPNAASLFASVWRYNDFTHTSSFTRLSLQFCLSNAGFSKICFVPGEPLRRPSFRIWRAKGRASWGQWALQKLWRMAFRHEFGNADQTEELFFDLNLRAHADK